MVLLLEALEGLIHGCLAIDRKRKDSSEDSTGAPTFPNNKR